MRHTHLPLKTRENSRPRRHIVYNYSKLLKNIFIARNQLNNFNKLYNWRHSLGQMNFQIWRCHSMCLLHPHSTMDIQPFSPVFPLADFMAEVFCWLFHWNFKEKGINHFPWHSLKFKTRSPRHWTAQIHCTYAFATTACFTQPEEHFQRENALGPVHTKINIIFTNCYTQFRAILNVSISPLQSLENSA